MSSNKMDSKGAARVQRAEAKSGKQNFAPRAQRAAAKNQSKGGKKK